MKEKNIFSKLGFSLFFMTLAVNLVQILMAGIISESFPDFTNSVWYSWSFVGIGFYLIGFPVFMLCTRTIPKIDTGERKKVSAGTIVKIFFISMAATYVFNIVGMLINGLIGLLKGGSITNPLEVTTTGSNIWVTILFGAILSPIIEEIVFRGILLNRVRGYGDKVAIIFTAIMFGLFHGNLSQFFYAVVLGMIFAYITVKTNTIFYSTLLHIIVNFTGLVGIPILVLHQNILLNSIGVILVLCFFLIGLILFFQNKKKVEFSEGSERTTGKEIYANAGVVCYIIICFMMIALVIVS